LTPAGRRLLGTIRRLTDSAPDAFALLTAKDIAELTRIFQTLAGR
jgi:hypothetical protein